MQDTGIIRRIDELGRVVIPKELRKKLRIREGDPLEIYTNKNEMVLKKYSPVMAIVEHAKAVAEGLQGVTGRVCIVTDTNSVIAVSSLKYSDLIGKEITTNIEKVIKERKTVNLSTEQGQTLIPVIKDTETDFACQLITPVVANGDGYGTVILFDKNSSYRFNQEDENLIKLGASFLSKQFED